MSAMIEGAAGGLITNLTTDLLSSFKKKWSIKGKKKRLEELLIQIQSVLDVTKSRVIRNKSLKRWLKKVEKAADHGDRALKTAKRLLVREKKPFSVVSPIRYVAAFAKKFLFTDSGAIKKLDSALEELETVCRNLKLFLRLIELEKSSKKDGFSVRHFRMKARKKCPLVVVSSSIQDRSDEKIFENPISWDDLGYFMKMMSLEKYDRVYWKSIDEVKLRSVIYAPQIIERKMDDEISMEFKKNWFEIQDAYLNFIDPDRKRKIRCYEYIPGYKSPLHKFRSNSFRGAKIIDFDTWSKNIRKKKMKVREESVSAFDGGSDWGNSCLNVNHRVEFEECSEFVSENHLVEDEGNSEIVKSCVDPYYTRFDNLK